MASLCMDMRRGLLLHYPRRGGALDQDMGLIKAMRRAHRVWYINEYMPANNISPDDDDFEFMQELIERMKDEDETD